VDTIEGALAMQGDIHHGLGAELVKLVHLAFKVLNASLVSQSLQVKSMTGRTLNG
jgi:hypothetical protein